MAKILRPRRGSTAANAGLVGGNGEITIDTDKSTIRVHDGATAGGTEMARMKDIPTKVSELENDANFTQFAGASATVDANTGTPSVTVTESGSGNNKGLVFSFKNLKGAKGDKGDKGDTGAKGDKGDAGTAYITEKWSSGTSWYRKYSDGWIEQGGYISVAYGSNTTTVTFPKSFAGTSYTVVLGDAVNNEADTWVGTRTAANMKLGRHWSGSNYGGGATFWLACGI